MCRYVGPELIPILRSITTYGISLKRALGPVYRSIRTTYRAQTSERVGSGKIPSSIVLTFTPYRYVPLSRVAIITPVPISLPQDKSRASTGAHGTRLLTSLAFLVPTLACTSQANCEVDAADCADTVLNVLECTTPSTGFYVDDTDGMTQGTEQTNLFALSHITP